MLTPQEQDFIKYWKANRQNKKRFLRQFSVGLPLSVGIVLVILVNLLSGWYKRAEMVLQTHSSVIIVVLIAGVGIATFITVFSSKLKWEQNEQRYQELSARTADDYDGNDRNVTADDYDENDWNDNAGTAGGKDGMDRGDKAGTTGNHDGKDKADNAIINEQ